MFLRGELVGDGAGGEEFSGSEKEGLRTCTSESTIFEDTDTLKESRDLFLERMDEVVQERETYLFSPSKWTCTSEEEAPETMEKLSELAEELPGWKYRLSEDVEEVRPVHFAAFDSILTEFEREYECKLTEFREASSLETIGNRDLENPAQFCCTDGDLCMQATENVTCAGGTTEDPACDGACEIQVTHADIATRTTAFEDRTDIERARARMALERTVHALRSFETSYAYARQLHCFQRASLDLKNQMSLLADAVSCMPKIWNAVTSVHDRSR